MKKVIVTKLSRAIRHVVSRGAQGPRGGLWGDWSEIPGKPDFDALYDQHGAASAAQSAAAEDATAKVNAHTSAPDPHPQYATGADLSGHTGNTSNPHSTTAAQVGADPAGAAASAQVAAIDAAAADATAKANAAQTAAVDTLRAGVAADGDTLAKLRALIQGIQTLLTSDRLDLDTLQEVVDFVEVHQSSLESLGTGKVNVSDIINVLTDASTAKPLSAAQGKVLKDLIDALTVVVSGKEPAIPVGTSDKYLRGDKTWADFAANVLATVLTGLSTASATVVAATDSVLVAIGKLQAQISDVVTQADAETGTSTARKSWTAQRVRQAIAAWWASITNIDGKNIGATTAGTGRFTTLTTTGNAGIGVASSAWIPSIKAMDVSPASAFWGYLFGDTAPRTLVSNNAYLNSAGNYIYKVDGIASEYRQIQGQHVLLSAPPGAAGGVITFTPVFSVERGKSIALQGAVPQNGIGISFPATQNASADANTLDDYREASYTATATGMTTAPTGSVSFVKTGNSVTMTIPAISGTSNATTFTLTGGPTTMRPSASRIVPARVQDNGGAVAWGMATIGTDGVITLNLDANGAAFTATGTKATAACTFSYTI